MTINCRKCSYVFLQILLYSAIFESYSLRASGDAVCSEGDLISSSVSPDNIHKLEVKHVICDSGFGNVSSAYFIVVSNVKGPSDEKEFFLEFDAPPNAAWVDFQHIIVTIDHIVTIKKSLHKISGIEISYQVVPHIFENYWNVSEKYLNMWKKSDGENDPACVYGADCKKNAIILRDVDYFNKFVSWYVENVE